MTAHPSVERSTLIKRRWDANTEPPLKTAIVLCDARAALLRGIAEYLQDLNVPAVEGGAAIQFQRVFDDWPDKEEDFAPPCAIAYSEEDGMYGAQGAKNLTPNVGPNALPNGQYLVQTSTFSLPFKVQCRVTESAERTQVMKALEDYLNPVDWMHGFRLILPHYASLTGDYSMSGNKVIDSIDDAGARLRGFEYNLIGSVAVVHLRSYVIGKAVVKSEITDNLE